MAALKKSLIDKLGVAPGARVAFIGLIDAELATAIAGRATLVDDMVSEPCDMILIAMNTETDLAQLQKVQTRIVRHGAIWVIWPKGHRSFNETMIREGALASGLVDVKVVRYSATLSGLKLVIPRAQR
jgi:hypothetical protein